MATEAEVMRVARLARLKIQESELEGVRGKFAAILESFSFLNEANTEGVAPLFHAAESMELRPDEPEAPLDREALLRNAPEPFENCFRIPRVVGGEE